MAACDPELGREIHNLLRAKNIQNPVDTEEFLEGTIEDLRLCFEDVHSMLGLTTGHDSTKETPLRLAKMYRNEILWGLDPNKFPKATVSPNDGQTDEIVLIRNIEVKSLCEHHWQPIVGFAHIAYMPKKDLLGLSKFNRIVEYFSRRPQLQERLTEQILHSLCYILGTEDVAVILSAEHFCVNFRGVEDLHSDTVTSRMSGRFMNNVSARAELMALIRLGSK